MKTNTLISFAVAVMFALTAGYFGIKSQRLARDNEALGNKVSALSLEIVQLKGRAALVGTRLEHHRKRQAELYAELAQIKNLPPYVYTPDDLGP